MTRPIRVLLTRAAGGNATLAERLRAAGFAVAEMPLIRIEPLDGPPLRLEKYDWVAVTSRHGVECLFRRLDGTLPRVAAIGPGTAEALRAHGVEPALVAERPTQEGLAAAFPNAPGRVLFAGAEGARDVLARALEADFVPLYRTFEEPRASVPDVDLVVLASASAARSLGAVTRSIPCVSIGPVTSEEARALGLDVAAEAEAPDADALVAATKLAASRVRSSRS